MARRVDGPQRPAITEGGDLAVGHPHIGVEREVERFLHLGFAGGLGRFGRRSLFVVGLVGCVVFHPIGADCMRPECNGGGARTLAQPGGQWRVVAMTVGDEDRAHPLTLERCHQRVAVRVDHRPGVDDGDVAIADDVGAGAVIRELRRVLGDDPPDEWRHLHGFAVARIVKRDERDAHGAIARTVPTWRP